MFGISVSDVADLLMIEVKRTRENRLCIIEGIDYTDFEVL